MKTKVISIIISCLAVFGMFSCEDDKPSLDFSGNVEIQSFTINGVSGEIDNTNATVTVMMEMGTDVSRLVPVIQVGDGAVISPASGETVDFTIAREYIVSDKDIYRKYQVRVGVIRAEITRFSIGNSEGIIDPDNYTIEIYIPESSDITNLAPIVRYTDGATITPEDGSVVDFTNPVKYTLQYLGSTFEYMVTVHLGNPPAQPQVIYNGEDVTPGWWTAGSVGEISSAWQNPSPNTVNPTASCVSIWRNPGDDPWTGGGLGGLEIDPTVYGRFGLMVLKDYAGDVQMEIQGEGGGNQYLRAYYSGDALGEWQQLYFDLPEGHNLTKIHTILVAPQIDDTKEDPNFVGQRMYWDQLIAYPGE